MPQNGMTAVMKETQIEEWRDESLIFKEKARSMHASVATMFQGLADASLSREQLSEKKRAGGVASTADQNADAFDKCYSFVTALPEDPFA
jgi:hypothetical protein